MRKFFLLLIISFSARQIIAQQLVIPPSPDASSFGTYANTPVSLFTGTPSISIPLIDVKEPDFDMPISLSYYAQGIKVEQIASSVGLGWSINAGGLITRSVVGLPDDYSGQMYSPNSTTVYSGYLKNNNASKVESFDWTADANTIHNTIKSDFISGSTDIINDAEPDIFFYNFNGNVGKFVIDKDRQIRLFPQKNLVCSCTFDANDHLSSFTMIDDKGSKFEFQDQETTKVIMHQPFGICGKVEIPLPTTSSFSYCSSWYLSKVTTPTGKGVNFVYNSATTEPQNYTIDKNILQYTVIKYAGSQVENSPVTIQINVIGKLIKQILTPDKVVNFNYSSSQREDLPGTNSIKNVELSYIDDLGFIFFKKRFTLGYDYFISDGIDAAATADKYKYKRLELKSVQESGSDGATKPPYTFNYNYSDKVKLPNILSFCQDQWGYYKANAATSMIPHLYIYSPPDGGGASTPEIINDPYRVDAIPNYTGTVYELAGADRSTKFTDNPTLQANILTQVNFPEGGYTQYSYEPKDYLYEGALYYGDGLRINTITTFDGLNHANDIVTGYHYYSWSTTQSSGVLINKPQFANLNYYNEYCQCFADYTSYLNQWNTDKQGYYSLFLKRSNINIASLGATSVNVGYTEVIVAQTGKGFSIYNFSCPGLYFDTNDQGGDNLYTPPIVGFDPESWTQGCFKYLNFTFSFNDYPYAPHLNYDWNRGLLTRKTDYSELGIVTHFIDNTYSLNYKNGSSAGIVKGILVSFIYPTLYNDCYPPPPYVWGRYQYLTDVSKVLHNSTETTYDLNDHTKFITSSKTYGYNNSGQVTSFTEGQSDGTNLATRYKYPGDYDWGNDLNTIYSGYASMLHNMVLKNQISTPIEVTHLNNNLVIGSEFNELITASNGSLVPGTQYSIFTNTPFVYPSWGLSYTSATINAPKTNIDFLKSSQYTPIVCNTYDATGNIIQTQKTNDIQVSYIWGYNNTYVVAEVKNASPDQIEYESFDMANVYPPSSISTDAKTGKYSWASNLLVGRSTPGTYMLTYWKKVIPGNWQLVQQTITGPTTIGVTGGRTLIDEVHVYPVGAKMTTYVYDPLIGMTSMTDENNNITYYIYDSLGRLTDIKDDQGNILKHYEYNYGILYLDIVEIKCSSNYTIKDVATFDVTTTSGSGDFTYNWVITNGTSTITNSSKSFSATLTFYGNLTATCTVDDNETGQRKSLSKAFTVQPKNIMIKSPAGSVIYHVGQTVPLIYDDLVGGNKKLEIYYGADENDPTSGTLRYTIASVFYDGSSGTNIPYDWPVPASPGTGNWSNNLPLNMKFTRISDNSDVAISGYFYIDPTPISSSSSSGGGTPAPPINITYPTTGTVWANNCTYTINWTSTLSGFVYLHVYLTGYEGATKNITADVYPYYVLASAGTYTFTINLDNNFLFQDVTNASVILKVYDQSSSAETGVFYTSNSFNINKTGGCNP